MEITGRALRTSMDRGLQPIEIRVLERRAAELFVVGLVEPVDADGVENLPEWLPSRMTRMNVPSPVELSTLYVMAMRSSSSESARQSRRQASRWPHYVLQTASTE
jgi:hypothetical protein